MRSMIIVCAVMLIAAPALAANLNNWWQPYDADANTLLLAHFDQNNPDANAQDSSFYGWDGPIRTAGDPPPPIDGFWSVPSFVPYAGFGNAADPQNGATRAIDFQEPSDSGDTWDAVWMDNSKDMTIDFWVGPRPHSGAHNRFTVMWMTGGQWSVSMDETDPGYQKVCYLEKSVFGTGAKSNTAIPIDDTAHVRIVVDKTTKALINKMDVSFYINGVFDGTTEIDLYTGTNPGSHLNVFTNQNFYWGSVYYGLFDELRIYDGNLGAPAQIPEPASIGLIGLLLATLIRRKK